MKKTRHVVLAILAGTLTTASAAKAPARLPSDLAYPPLAAFKIPTPQRIVLPNGLIVLLLPNSDLPLVEGMVMVNAGSRLEPAAKVGLASITGQVLRSGGTKRRGADDLDDLLEGIGASIETSIGEDAAEASFSCLSQNLDQVLGVVAEILSQPAFVEDRIEMAKTGEKTDIARRNDDVTAMAMREFTKLVYGADSVYARHPEYATIDAITRDDVVRFHADNFYPNRTLLGLTGDFTVAGVKGLLNKHFAAWKKGPAATKFTGGYQTATKPGYYFVEKSDVNQSNVGIGHLGTTYDNPDYFALDVMNEVFGGGFSSRLFSNIRSKKGLAYAVGGGVRLDYDHPGAFRIGLRTKSGTTIEGIKALHEEIENIRSGPPSADEMDRAKSSILNSFVFNFDTRTEVLRRQLVYELFGYPLDFLDRYRTGIEKVTAADVHRVAMKYIQPDQLVQLVVGKSADFDKPLADLGAVKTLDVTIPVPKVAAVEATPKELEEGMKVVARVQAAMGGAPLLQSCKTMRVTGTMTMGPQSAAVTLINDGPNRLRQDFQAPMGLMTMVVDGDAGFMRGPGMERDVPAPRRLAMVTDLARTLRVLLAQANLTAQHLGRDTVDGVSCDKVLVAHGELAHTLWVDASGTVIKDAYSGEDAQGLASFERSYGDWRVVSGLKLPHVITVARDGKPASSLKVDTYEVNPTFAGTEFQRQPAP